MRVARPHGRAGRNWPDNLRCACNKFWYRRGGINHHWHVQIDPENLPDDPALLQQMLGTLLGQHGELHAEYEKIRLLLSRLTRHQFGRRSEQLTDEQLQLGLEDLQQSIAENRAGQDAAEPAHDPKPRHKRSARNHGALPAHLPRYDVVIDDAPESCPCCGGTLHCIGETTSEQLDIVPAQLRVRVTRRPRYACRSCEEAVVVGEAPARPIDGGMPTEALIIHVLISKYCGFLPLYRQS
jgi:transposase